MCERIWYFRVCFPSDTEQNTTMSKPSIRQNRTKKKTQKQQTVAFSLDMIRGNISLCFSALRSRDTYYCSYFRKRGWGEKKKGKQNPRQSRKGGTLLVPGSDPASVGFLCGGTGIKAAPLFLPEVGSRAAKEPPSLKWENQGTGSAETLQDISRAILHSFPRAEGLLQSSQEILERLDVRVGSQQQNWGKVTDLCGALGQPLCVSFMSRAPRPAFPDSLMVLEPLFVLSAPGRGIFCGYQCLDEFPPWGNPGCGCLQRRQRAARHHLSPRAFSERLAWRPGCLSLLPFHSR